MRFFREIFKKITCFLNIPKMKHKVMIPVHNNNFMCPKKSIQSLQKVSHSAAYLKAFENCYQMEKLHCSSENNTENQNKYFILIIINLKEYMFFFLLFIPLICFFSIFRKTERLSHISIRSFASKLIIFYFILEKLKILSRSTSWFKQHFYR